MRRKPLMLIIILLLLGAMAVKCCLLCWGTNPRGCVENLWQMLQHFLTTCHKNIIGGRLEIIRAWKSFQYLPLLRDGWHYKTDEFSEKFQKAPPPSFSVNHIAILSSNFMLFKGPKSAIEILDWKRAATPPPHGSSPKMHPFWYCHPFFLRLIMFFLFHQI